jgi:LmbE family N-acetylglucosaminyl deacetylase
LRLAPLVLPLAALVALSAVPARTARGGPAAALPRATGGAPAGIDPRTSSALPAGELREAIAHLRVLASVLYVGAHPDDDNTSLLAALARGRGVRMAYLSLTRGDGGQNILGAETGEALGVLRTQELLASRRVDGAEQLFGRALDFGFSKSPDEALAKWGHDTTLADVVWLIRLYQPDVIITRFGTDGSGGHGHHTASAILAGEAFRAAADSTRFVDPLSRVAPWRAKRLLWNTWAPKLEGRAGDAPPLLTMDIGGFDAALGASYPEIGGRARSLNRSQGAGTPERRGRQIEYFEQVDGPRAARDPFEGVAMGWTRVPGGATVDSLLSRAERELDPAHPEAVLRLLARAHAAMERLLPRAGADAPRVRHQLAATERVMRAAAGLWLEAQAESPSVCPGDTVAVTLTAIDRTGAPVRIISIAPPFGARAFYRRENDPSGPPAGSAASAAPRPAIADSAAPADRTARDLPANLPVVALTRLVVPADAALSQPYWLLDRLGGASADSGAAWQGEPERPAAPPARVMAEIAGESVEFEVPLTFRWTDRVYGDRFRALEVLPPVTCRLDQPVYLFASAAPRDLRCTLQSTRGGVRGTLRLTLPTGWRAAPDSAAFTLAGGGEQTLSFRVTPGASTPADATDENTVRAVATVGGAAWSLRLQRIDQPHIPMQALLEPAEARLLRADVRTGAAGGTSGAIGYLMGSGDQVPDALAQMGFAVTLLSDDDVEHADLSRFGCIVTGVRAYNVRPALRALEPRLLEYVAAGGRLVVQYLTPEAAVDDRIGPWPLKISRDRVTDENAEMSLLQPAHPMLNVPNRIGPADFTGWIQERGLSYAGPLDARYVALLSAHDPGEAPLAGGLVVAHVGQGDFVYTGLAFFRQLPAGVPGAWRLFANLVSRSR